MERLEKIRSHIFQNPIVRMYDRRELETETGSFSPIVIQTGAGKTHWGVNWLAWRACSQYFAPQKSFRPSVYLTPNTHNVKAEYEKFTDIIAGLRLQGFLKDYEAQDILDATLMLPARSKGMKNLLENFSGYDDFIGSMSEVFPGFTRHV